ncbi:MULTISPECIES: Tex family protein [unclassified Herbaspirillum]|uniref:Tex family protein n=1 Tax=unclassified Herbaspirillum TaxID=2624150 RepID=UPI000E2ED574|nr:MULTISPECIES: Tex family protein [unclassified Herbaspirillum]RFB70981.1 RNA-binding transcriptional accessory protein [Herbaspirillum sp. 3R-3a1]TFI08495.1 RNA-binding transcriptional accessory protein [Herbaspirillum sp. 3R11]TFI14909.1 RNA-binding transcriptional accessory protein [Herbaspirillum sp. 3R-11]TFI25142.1 RNA-binding transcriptional accessory protein [Herbaspirillum sp. 3C11]
MLPSIEQRLALELVAKPVQVAAAIALLDEGATVPFIARYRKEATGGLDDTQLRLLEERLRYLRELEDRRAAIISSIEEQGKMTPVLLDAIVHAEDKTRLEDLYLPYKLKRRTKAQIAAEAGLTELADALLNDPMLNPEEEAAKYLKPAFTTDSGDNPGVADTKAALDGARQILMERFAEDAQLLQALREYIIEHGVVESKVIEGKQDAGEKFADYFDYSETIGTIPSHRALALFRGRREEMLTVVLRLDTEEEKPKWDAPHNPCENRIAARFGVSSKGRPADKWLADTVRWAWRVKVFMHLETELMTGLRERSEAEAINVFARNLKDLLLAAPAGPRATMGLDPGLRTGVKVAVVDATGKVVDTTAIFPHQPRNDWEGSLHTLAKLAEKHNVSLISIGNGTASRETDKLAQDLIKMRPELKLTKIVVSEAGASVYSASEFASKELPDLDVSIRGAVSIARRLQDPLAELVKIDPKSIGVGQYQHDVGQSQLARSLDAVVEDCVNAVGVDVNTASAPLLARVSGLNASVAQSIVSYRDMKGMFTSRAGLREVPRLGDKTFEQAAGFLRVMNGENPLDASTVHPESYPLVNKILADIKKDLKGVLGETALLKSLSPAKYADEKFGVPTVTDILKELEKPGRDPRPEFTTATFKDGVEEIKDLRPDMILEGVVTNVAAFGAFVDIGVHQDGLVHISALSNTFVKDPHTVVKAGQVVKVKVLEVDEKRKRIALTMRLSDSAPVAGSKPEQRGDRNDARRLSQHQGQQSRQPAPANNAMAAAFAKLKG